MSDGDAVSYRAGGVAGDEVAVRAARRADVLAAAPGEAELLLITGLRNVRYLSGFSGSHGVLALIRPGAARAAVAGADGTAEAPSVLGTDGRYTLQCGQECPELPLLIDRAALTGLARQLTESGVHRIAVEADHLTMAQGAALVRDFGCELVPTSGLVEQRRTLKDPGEIEALRAACAASDAALTDLVPSIRVGMTEIEIARRLEWLMGEHGAEAPAFETIVAGGPNSAIPHHSPTARALESGDFLKIDFGARVRGYHADMTRTFVVGAGPAAWQSEVHALVSAAQAAGRAALGEGVELSEVDRASRGIIEDAGYAEQFPHGLGHGVGLEIHEVPFLGARAAGRLRTSMTVTVEPGVYLPGRGGVRIEDTLLVTDSGSVPLTMFPRELTVVG